MGTVWSIVCAMNLGLFPESSLKDITFVNFFHHIFMKKLCSAEGITAADLEEDSDREEPKHVSNNNNNTSAATLWPFMQAVRNAPALNNSVRKRGKRRRGRWTQKRQKKPRDAPTVLMVKRPRIDDAANAKSAMMKQRRAAAAAAASSSSASSLKSGAAAGSPGYNFSFMALHSRLPGGSKVDETRDYLSTTSSAYRTALEDGVREPPTTRETDTASEPPAATDRSAPRRSGTGATTLSSDMQEPKRGRRSAANLPTGHTDYYKNVARVNDDMGDIWEDTTSNSDEGDDRDNDDDDDDDDDDNTSTSTGRRAVTRGKKKADLANGDSSDHESTSSHGTTGRRLPSRRRRNRLLENRKERDGSSSVLLRNGKIRKRRQRRRRSVAIDERGSRLVLAARRNSSRQQSLRRRVVDAAPAPRTKDAELAEKTRKRCDYCTNRPRRRNNAGGASCTCKENLKNTATAILRDIRAHIHNADQRSAEDVETTEDPDEGRDCEGDSDRDVSMKYEWEDEWEEEDEGGSNATTADNEETTKAPARTYPGRKPRKKRRWHKAPIDCEFVDRTETTYQSVLPERVDDSTTPSTPSLKIHVDEVNWVSDESDVGGSMLHLEPRRSSLSKRRDPAPAADELLVAADDQDGAARQERNALMASACYVYPETTTPSNHNAVADVAKAPADARPPRSNAKTNHRRENPTKDVITYGKRSVGKAPSLTDRGDRKSQDSARVQAKSAADSNRDNDSDNENEKKYGLRRRSTRSSINSTKESNVGKLIWGNCSGWWPALIVEADQVGMAPESGKMWVYWIGESQISLLNEKTQIEPFSRKLEERLTQKFRKNNTRSQAIDETIKMLRQRYECTLTKPYYYWIRRNIKAEELDNLCFYPYPTKIQERLDALKQQNAKATEQYMLKQRSGSPEPPKKQVVEKAKDTKALKQMEDERLPLREQIPGVITWAKITGHNWWPAMVIDYRDCCLKEPGFGCQWIMWYGDYTVSQVHHLAFLKFHKGIDKLREYIENTKKHVYLMGVLQASKDYCSRLGCNTDNWSLDNVFKYFSDMTNIHVPYNHLQVSESNKVYDKYSNEIIKKINELKSNPNVDSKRKDDIKESDALRRVMLEQSKLNKLCLKCLTFPKDVLEAHPFFEGSLCRECSNDFKPCMFVFGNDDKCFYCTVCAATGTVVICDREDCPRVYCTACLKYLLCPEVYEEMLLEDPWECFLCRDKSTLPKGLLRPRDDWKERFAGMFRTGANPVSNMNIVNSDGEKRGVRVLSLFDGLSTGLVVLLKLGIIVDVYYASEIDQDSLTISSAHFGDRITYLGDVRNVTKEKVKEIMPIDLLIGGSPCNDLSLVNPARLGLHNPKGTGILFFEYIRILKQLKKSNKGHHLFWLYENVASMPSEFRLEMNKHLGQEPMVIDSADFSPQHRLRLYWHNLPQNPYFPQFQKQQDVQDILTPNCNRYALVKKIRTVTTRTNSLRQGKAEMKPIMMKGTSDTLWITELEEIFGFPRHYTDVKNLSATNRQRLIGKSWSVQTLTAILRPLCSYFKCNEDEKSQFKL